MISAWICSAAWRRFDVTRLVLQQRSRLTAELAASGIQATMLIAADDENLDIAAEYGAETLRIRNQPLGAKCNRMLRHAAENADWVIWVGSDDWIHPDTFEPLLTVDRGGPALVFAGGGLAMVDLTTGRLQRIGSPSRFGAVPWLLDSRLFTSTRYTATQPIRADLGRGLDGALMRGLRRIQIPFEVVIHDPHPFRAVDFKTAENLSPFELTRERIAIGDPETLDALEGWFPSDLIDQARALVHSI